MDQDLGDGRELISSYLIGKQSLSDLFSQLLTQTEDASPLQMSPPVRAALRSGARYVRSDGSTFSDYTDPQNYPILGGLTKAAEAIEQINRIARSDDKKPIVLGLFCGGTLAMVSINGVLQPAKSGAELLKSAGHGLEDKARLVTIEIPKIDSVDQNAGYVSELVAYYHYIARKITDEAKQLFAGVVIGHGTDTASETGALIRYLHTAYQIPVVMVCAQYAASSPAPDGPGNIAASVSAILQMHREQFADLYTHSGGGIAGALIPMGHAVKIADGSPIIFNQRGMNQFEVSSAMLNQPNPFRYSSLHYRGERRLPDSYLPIPFVDSYIPVDTIAVHQNEDPQQLGCRIVQSTERPFICVSSMGTATLPDAIVRSLRLTQAIFDEKARHGDAPHRQIVVLTAFPDANLEHSYASSANIRESGIPICCMPLPEFLMKVLVVCTLSQDPKERLRLVLAPWGLDIPPHAVNSYPDESPRDQLLRSYHLR